MSVLDIKWTKYIPHKPYPKQIAFLSLPHEEAFYGGAAGGGKVLVRSHPVLTPFGWRNCEDLEVGDRINAPDGTTSKIIQLHPWVKLPGVKVTFHDGSSTVVAWDHLWLSWRSGKKKKLPNGECCFGEAAAEVVETRELYNHLEKAKQQEKNGTRPNWPLIPVCHPQVFNIQSRHPILLDSYQLGLWLGDGSCSNGRVKITSGDMEHIISSFDGNTNCNVSGIDFCLRGETNKHWVKELERGGLLGKTSKDKFIPRQYLFGSVFDRWELLRGLMDTDGTVDKRGHLSYCTISDSLKDHFVFLVQSLGGTATPTKKKTDTGYAWNIYIKFRDEQQCFKLQRKIDRCQPEPGPIYRRVINIQEVEEVEGRCLTVSHPSGLYLTENCIVTHNSDALLMGALQYVDVPGYSAILFRRSLTDHKLANSMLSRAKDWLSPFVATKEVKWVPGEHAFHFPSGAKVAFGYLASEGTELRYQSAEYQYIGFDEVTHFWEPEYTYLFSRIRRLEGANVPLRMRAASNPGGRGHMWVKKRFRIEENENGDFVGMNPEAPYIPARVADNPSLDQEGYLSNLDKLGRVERERLKHGDWSVSQDAIFNSHWFIQRWQRKNTGYHLPDAEDGIKVISDRNLLKFVTVDCASSVKTGVGGQVFYKDKQASYSVIATWGLTPRYDLLLLDINRGQWDIPTLVDNICNNQKINNPQFNRIEANGPGQGVYQMCERRGLLVKPIQTQNDKVINSTAAQLRAERGQVYLPGFAPWLKELEEELFSWTGHPDETDDQIDVLSSAANEAAERAVGIEFDTQLRTGTGFESPTTTRGIHAKGKTSRRYAGLTTM